MKKNKLIKTTKYLSNKQSGEKNSRNEVTIEQNEEYIKVYFVKHFVNNIGSY